MRLFLKRNSSKYILALTLILTVCTITSGCFSSGINSVRDNGSFLPIILTNESVIDTSTFTAKDTINALDLADKKGKFIGGSIIFPKPVYTVSPALPKCRTGRKDNVIVLVNSLIDTSGRVVMAVIKKSKDACCNKAALRAVIQWRYKYPDQYSDLRPIWMLIPFRFSP